MSDFKAVRLSRSLAFLLREYIGNSWNLKNETVLEQTSAKHPDLGAKVTSSKFHVTSIPIFSSSPQARVPSDGVSLQIAAEAGTALKKRFLVTLRQDPLSGDMLFTAERAGAFEREECVIGPAELQHLARAASRRNAA